MAHYLIHAVPKRMWYVEKYLIPSMKEQGCKDIDVYVDEKQEGNLQSYINAYLTLPDDKAGTWHLEDDVVICKDFRRRTEFYDGGIVCGFSSKMYDEDKPAGIVNVEQKWFSFPCIRIPNKIARECAEWIATYIIGNAVYRSFWEGGKNIDWAFWSYVRDYYYQTKIENLAPNLVDHVDYLVGGSSCAKKRVEKCRSQYWEDEYVVEKLAEKLSTVNQFSS